MTDFVNSDLMDHRKKLEPDYLSDPKVTALQVALHDRDPFYSGICSIPGHQHRLYYTRDDATCRIDFPNPAVDDLEALYHACKPAEFGRNGENVLDEPYRKAGKMDLTSFATLLDPHELGIDEQASKALLTETHTKMSTELYKMNVYGKGDFFKAHKDTPHGQNMFWSLVVVLPSIHEGGQLVLREDGREWTIDFSDKFAVATEPSTCFVAFYGDIEHEVLPVTSGYRVTLTYNLYKEHAHPSVASIPTPFRVKLKQVLARVVNDKSKLPNGGYLGFGLIHEYVHTGTNLIEPLLGQLKGSDRALADVCDELGLRYSFRLLYRGIAEPGLNLITTGVLDVDEGAVDYESLSIEYLEHTLDGCSVDNVEGVMLVDQDASPPNELSYEDIARWLKPFYRTPITEVLEITPMKSSVDVKTTFMTYGNEAELAFLYGTACMLIAVDPAGSRRIIEV